MQRRRKAPGWAGRRAHLPLVLLAALISGAGVTVAQDGSSGDAGEGPPDVGRYVANAAEIAEAADWDNAATITLVMSESAFTPDDIVLDAGRPYVIELFNVADVPRDVTFGHLMRTVATLRGQTAQSYLRVPFFSGVEVFPGARVQLSVVPLVPGTYEIASETTGDPGPGASATVTVTSLPAPEFAEIPTAPWVQEGAAIAAAADWDRREQVTVELSEFSFSPQDLRLIVGQPYEIRVMNVGELTHEFTAREFFDSVAFAGAIDASAGFRAPAPSEVEVVAGESASLFLVPTSAGTFDLVCEIEGHLEAGMSGTILVSVAP